LRALTRYLLFAFVLLSVIFDPTSSRVWAQSNAPATWTAVFPTDAETQRVKAGYRRAYRFYKNKEFKDAEHEINILLQTKTIRPIDVGRAYQVLAGCYWHKHNSSKEEWCIAKALAAFKDAGLEDENSISLVIAHASLLMLLDRYSEADPLLAEGARLLQEHYLPDGRKELLRRLVRELVRYTDHLYEKSEFKKAEDLLNEIFDSNDNLSDYEKAQINHLLGKCYTCDEDFERADQCFSLSAALYQKNPGEHPAEFIDVLIHCIDSSVKLSKFDAAFTRADSAKLLLTNYPVQTKDETSPLDSAMEVLYCGLSDWKNYKQVVEGVLARQGSSKKTDKAKIAHANTCLGYVLLEEKELKKARTCFNEALHLVPSDGYSLWNLATIDDLEGRRDAASKEYPHAIAENCFPDQGVATLYRRILAFRDCSEQDYYCGLACSGYTAVWPAESMPLKVYISESGNPSGFTADAKRIIRSCLDEWCATMPNRLSYTFVDDPEIAQIRFYQVDSTWLTLESGEVDGCTPPTLGTEGNWSIFPMRAATIRIRNTESILNEPENHAATMRRIILHEIGHALGIMSESPNAADIMREGCLPDHLSAADASTIHRLYGKNLTADSERTIRRMAQSGNAYAQDVLGWVYEAGLGPTKDFNQAKGWYEKAANQGLAEGSLYVGDLYLKRDSATSEDFILAAQWFEKATKLGSSQASVELATVYAEGKGVPKDEKRAFELYTTAAKARNIEAQLRVGDCYRNGRGVRKDTSEAVRWYIKSAKQSNAVAQRNLGEIYTKGTGVEKNEKESFFWYQLAAMQNDTPSQICLAKMYEIGSGTMSNLDKTKFWYGKAASAGDAQAKKELERLDSKQNTHPKAS
jgi:TPR repeat protein